MILIYKIDPKVNSFALKSKDSKLILQYFLIFSKNSLNLVEKHFKIEFLFKKSFSFLFCLTVIAIQLQFHF